MNELKKEKSWPIARKEKSLQLSLIKLFKRFMNHSLNSNYSTKKNYLSRTIIMIDNIFLMLKNPTKLDFFPHGYVSAKIVKKKK